MASENLERIYYTLLQQGRYYVINKVRVLESLPESPKEGDFASNLGATVTAQGELLFQYLYPINNSYIRSIVKDVEDSRLFGILLINSLSVGTTFLFSAEGIDNGEYVNPITSMPYTYDSLLDLFINGGKTVVFPIDETK